MHANFIENLGDARSADVIALMAEARRRARERFGVELHHEVQMLGPIALPDGDGATGGSAPRSANFAPMQVVAGVENGFMARRRALARSQGRRRLTLLLALAAAVLPSAATGCCATSSAFEVTGVQVAGAPPKLSGQIEAAVAAETHGRSLLGMDASSIAQRVEPIPFVRSATVDRAFPHTLAVHVRVYHPRAYATIGSQGYLIAADGRVLGAATEGAAAVAGVSLPDGTTLAIGSSPATRTSPRRSACFGRDARLRQRRRPDHAADPALGDDHRGGRPAHPAAVRRADRAAREDGRGGARDAPDPGRPAHRTWPTSTCPRPAGPALGMRTTSASTTG